MRGRRRRGEGVWARRGWGWRQGKHAWLGAGRAFGWRVSRRDLADTGRDAPRHPTLAVIPGEDPGSIQRGFWEVRAARTRLHGSLLSQG